MGPDELAQRQRGDRFQLVHRTRLWRHQPGGQPLRAPADPYVAEVHVAAATLPHPPAARDRPQRGGIGMGPLQRRALFQRRLSGAFPHLAQVAQVVLAVLIHLGLGLATPAAAADEHADGRRQHHDGNSRNTGLLLASPVVKTNATMPRTAAIITTGRIFCTMLPGRTLGTSGGASRWTSPPGIFGAVSRGDRRNCTVLTPAHLRGP